jgi:hypothetical protein
MLNSPLSLSNTLGRAGKWLILAIVIVALALLFARKITQLALPGLGVPAKTTIIEPHCPTPEQKEVIERNLNLYGAGFSRGYDNTEYARNLVAMAKALGYPEPTLDEINAVLRFLREALKKKC